MIKLNKSCDQLADIMKTYYDKKRLIMDIQSYPNLFDSNAQALNKTFVDKINLIVEKQTSMAKKIKHAKNWTGMIKKGDWFSFTQHLKVVKIEKNNLEVVDLKGEKRNISMSELLGYHSAVLY